MGNHSTIRISTPTGHIKVSIVTQGMTRRLDGNIY